MSLSNLRFAALLLSCAGISTAAEPPWTALFDGKTLNGWRVSGGTAKFDVIDGVLIGESRPNTEHTFLCAVREYGDFVLEYEFKVDAALNSGVQVRSHADERGRVIGYQV